MSLDLSARAQAIHHLDPLYPNALRDLGDPPSVIRLVGDLPSFADAVSIVGTRRADDEALEFTYDLASALAREGISVISGGALGVDSAAHEGALDAGGCTVVVLPVGLDVPYPPANAKLFERVTRAGCLLTEVPDGADMQRGRFLKRNRLIAALAESTVVIQAPARSGALSTARHARTLGRCVFCRPRFALGSTRVGQPRAHSQRGEDLRGRGRCPIRVGCGGRRNFFDRVPDSDRPY